LLLWWIITGGSTRQLWFGAAVILAILALPGPMRAPGATGAVRLAPWALVCFVGIFLWQSILGGLQVAWVALRPRHAVRPSYKTYRVRIGNDHGAARMTLAASVCLLPGTLSCDLHDDDLVLHVLDQGMFRESAIRSYERRLAAVFFVQLPA
jgi:multicomponent Na+:H+ antiporter subunit E